MKKLLFVLLLFLGVGCSESKKVHVRSTLVISLEETFEDDFFNQYRDESGRLNVITEFRDIYKEISSENSNLSFSLDSVNRGQLKYLSVSDYQQQQIVRLQLACYNLECEPYYIQYSTSYRIIGSGKLKLINKVSPYIDTLQVEMLH